ncbi:outer membrane lipid asymmetry maintenance protein MlaD [Desulfovibrio sp. OttesenSCG-928-O18]|nr:outer membrane lipid asymmetry maintenance protein MlaD [Desulfovibrio sp. OttesenSCG-928-O18]
MYSKKYSMEFLVGIFVLIGLLCVGYLTIQLGKMEFFSNSGYTLVATFDSTTGLRSGANVEIAGVSVGKVTKIELDEEYNSRVSMRIRDGVKISGDTGAAIKTSGLIGDKYVSLTPGGAEDDLTNGGELTETQGSINIEDLISKYVFGSVK